MNELVKFNDKKIELTKSQLILYKFFYDKLEKDEPVLFEEAKEMYIKHSCRDVVKGIPQTCWYYWNNGKCTEKWHPMTESDLRLNIANYIIRGLGALVVKGALKITPQLHLN